MDYYKSKRMALIDIRLLAEQGHAIEDIRFAILEKYGFPEKFVNSYYTTLEERGLVKKPKK